MTLSNLNKTITHCTKCERLVNFREKIAKEKRKQYNSIRCYYILENRKLKIRYLQTAIWHSWVFRGAPG